jgi:hypothetical protein
LDEHGEYERGVFNLLHGVGADGGVIYEVGARAGEHTSLFHSSTTSYDGIIAWEGRDDLYGHLERSMHEYTESMFNKTMIIKHNASSLGVHEGEKAVATMQSVYDQSSRCPTLVKILDGQGAATLLESRALLAKCVPIVYVENDCEASSFSTIASLEEIGYTLYWHASTALQRVPDASVENEVFIGMLALYEPDHATLQRLRAFPVAKYVMGKYMFKDYELNLIHTATQGFQLVREAEMVGFEDAHVVHSSTTLIQHTSTDSVCVHAGVTQLSASPVFSRHIRPRISYDMLPDLCGESFHVELVLYDLLQFENSEERAKFEIQREDLPGGETSYVTQVSPMEFTLQINCLVVESLTESRLETLWNEWVTSVDEQCTAFLNGDVGFGNVQEACTSHVMARLRSQIENRAYQGLHPVHVDEEQQRNEAGLAWDHMSFSTDKFVPFLTNFSSDEPCGDPIWCTHYHHLLKRVIDYQNPNPYPFIRIDSALPDGTDMEQFNALSQYRSFSSDERCNEAKFLIYQIPSEQRGIGSLFHLISSMLRFAICHGRILYLMPLDLPVSEKRWRFPGCRGGFMDCFFLPLTQCTLSSEQVRDALTINDGVGLDLYPWKNERVLRMVGLPSNGRCRLCGDRWEGNKDFFDGVYFGELGYMVSYQEDGTLDTWKTSWQHEKYKQLWHLRAMQSDIKAPWQSTMIRYLLRPRPWLSSILKDIVDSRLVTATLKGSKSDDDDDDDNRPLTVFRQSRVPAPYVSMHVRFGNKALEQKLKPLLSYMRMMQAKYPHVRNVFVSTETEKVIDTLVREYPSYNFYFIDYPRKEVLSLRNSVVDFNYVDEFLYSMANLYVATHAQGFIGTLTSNWCSLVMEVERTRGDGGTDYMSLDQGSSMSLCF